MAMERRKDAENAVSFSVAFGDEITI